MSIRSCEIPISQTTRDKLKTLKRELTYDQYLNNLIGKVAHPEDNTTIPEKPIEAST